MDALSPRDARPDDDQTLTQQGNTHMNAAANVTSISAGRPSFVSALRGTFFAPDAKPPQIMAEIKALTPADKKWYSDAMRAAGIGHADPLVTA